MAAGGDDGDLAGGVFCHENHFVEKVIREVVLVEVFVAQGHWVFCRVPFQWDNGKVVGYG